MKKQRIHRACENCYKIDGEKYTWKCSKSGKEIDANESLSDECHFIDKDAVSIEKEKSVKKKTKCIGRGM